MQILPPSFFIWNRGNAMSFQEYHVDMTKIYEWLPWGGITAPNMLEQKDGSFVGIIRYKPYPVESPAINLPELPRGWALLVDRHHIDGQTADYLAVTWNPFEKADKTITNTLDAPLADRSKCRDYFQMAIETIAEAVGKVTEAKTLREKEILDYLTETLNFGHHYVSWPEVPLFLDALLSQDTDFKMEKNGIRIDGDRIIVVSLMGMRHLKKLFHMLEDVPYRHVRRLVTMNGKQMELDCKRYTRGWCASRRYILKGIINDIQEGSLHGYYNECLVFCMNDLNYDRFIAFLTNYLTREKYLCRFEDYNLKDIWWGTLPGIFRADVEPPSIGFDGLGELLLHPDVRQKRDDLDIAADKLEKQVVLRQKGV